MKKNDYTWLIFIFYALLLGYGVIHHELWGDEVHSWNIAKGSGSYLDLIANRRYEGHPPAWHTVLWVISKFTHNVIYMQAAQWLIACAVVFIILFYSPFARSTRMLLPFGYYFLFEYGVLSRNYALGVLFACMICLIIRREFKYKPVLYYALLFCMSNVHLLALLLAGSLHLYFLLLKMERKTNIKTIAVHVLAGVLVFLPAAYFIIPPADGELNTHALLNMWNVHQVFAFYEVPLRALLPIPAWWRYNFWNTQFLISAKDNFGALTWINPLITLMLLSVALFVLRRNKKSAAVFTVNLLLSLIVSVTFFSLTTARYTGFIYIGFIMAYWLYCYEAPFTGKQVWLVNILLAIQLSGGVFALYKDIRLPFSNTYRVGELIKEIPPNEKWVTDYWTMNAIVAYTDHPAYCIDMQKEMSFVLWGIDITALQKMHSRYCNGLEHFFKNGGIKSVYMVTQATLPQLQRTDSLLSTAYCVTLIDKREGAIEKGSNIYLYRISALHPMSASQNTACRAK
jgi:hypothetical protein